MIDIIRESESWPGSEKLITIEDLGKAKTIKEIDRMFEILQLEMNALIKNLGESQQKEDRLKEIGEMIIIGQKIAKKISDKINLELKEHNQITENDIKNATTIEELEKMIDLLRREVEAIYQTIGNGIASETQEKRLNESVKIEKMAFGKIDEIKRKETEKN
ncbi:MAG: hypothetical protein UR46_C0004G0005 [Parcubacteria group bacterium GW2011_GWA1_33_6]|uniref:Uncharacterized protein n=1 Tax=Candidatus Staskawiczbacteria bacterium RIFCSPHIGHO2_02_FULL_33_16 TaxID=1802204 RepID=A0A1G2HWJ9_9BACT|nr:MAG: hypothetical protein UR31_C0001G0052 [Parcubacteria group bacterium GW2011_GWA2_33_14]KKP55435.1 MAG: hypothetical protein UR46_C0004G0005 [Parcubacteria group bacterium GW2011_GWA1_33_6]OGZ66926.1 MAG: hypothetical protein A3D34_02060 [Candidatus Staskawiczbacteria bacterium RIFCSPHIGHO2_02_FULL_33_16]OGZ70846.1 MAG: hypothetical protein A2980_02350 [Candidatus Staskawiczbacteria bacterium RIFCSPLOWO2_01_FULL_33_13]